MKKLTVHEVSRLAGVSVRTLHYYDSIGLLMPSDVTEAGYRLYDDTALERLQSILLFRELQFPLREIKRIMDDPDYDRADALDTQIKLLEMQYERLGKLITFARSVKEKGEDNMNFNAFDKTKIDEYTAQAKAKWGSTHAYKEYEENSKGKTDAEIKTEADGLMEIFKKFGKITERSADSDEAMALSEELQNYISRHYYTCTDEIFAGLALMYSAEGEMKDNIDRAGGKGTAEYAAKAINAYLERK